MDEIEYEGILQWCCQKQYYNDMLSLARQAIDAFSSNDRLKILLSLSCALNGHSKEALKHTSSMVRTIQRNIYFYFRIY